MTGPSRSPNIGFPIRVFVDIPSSDTLDAFTALINDVNRYLALFAAGTPANYALVSMLPVTAPEGTLWYATNGRKIGEGAGFGTGVWVNFSNGSWRVLSTDAPVTS